MAGLVPILLFVKAPVTGRVKTRLAAAVGDDAALELYRSFVLDLLEILDSGGFAATVLFDPPDAADAVAAWLGRNRRYLPQQGHDLGERMKNAFQAVFGSGAPKAILIGSDLPDLRPQILIEALDALERHDAVIGPALDGGYYLIGFRDETFRPEVFRNVPWSTPDVFEITMRRFTNAGAQVHPLPQWRDVDTIEDLRDLYERNQGAAFERSRTMQALREVCSKL